MFKFLTIFATTLELLTINIDEKNAQNNIVEIVDFNTNYYDSYNDENEYGATNITEEDYYELNMYQSNLYGDLGYTDYQDYAYFKMLTTSSFTINFTILYSYFYNYYEYYSKVEVLVYDLFDTSVFYYLDSNFNLSVYDANPSTYIIRIKQKDGFEFQTTINYLLELTVLKSNANYCNADIRDLTFNKELGGAVWISDYNHGYLGNYNNIPSMIYNGGNTNQIVTTLDDLLEISGGKNIHIMSIYLWDDLLKQTLKSFCYSLINILSNYVDSTVSSYYELTETDGLLSLIFYAVDTAYAIYSINLTPIVSLFGSLTLSTIEELVMFFLGQNNTDFSIFNRYNFLCSLYNCLDSEDDIVVINLFYKIRKESGKYYIDRIINTSDILKMVYFYRKNNNFTTNNEEDDNDYNIIYNNINSQNSNPNKLTIANHLYSSNDYNSYAMDYYNIVRGKIYGFEGFCSSGTGVFLTECNLITSYQNISHGFTNAYLDTEFMTGNFSNGEYIWKKFTAPSNGNYYIQVETYNSDSLIIDLFSAIDSGYDNTHLLSSFDSSVGQIMIGTKYRSFCSYYLNSNNYVYLRIHSVNFEICSSQYFVTILDEEPSAPHTHMYIVTTHNARVHKYICSCGDYYYEMHEVTEFSNICITCGARVSGGLIHGFLDPENTLLIDPIIYFDEKKYLEENL